MISGASEAFIKSVSLFEEQLVRQNITILANSIGKIWIVSALLGDYLFEIFLGLMFYSASILIHRNERIPKMVSFLGKPFAFLGLMTIFFDLFETTLFLYMLIFYQIFPDWIVVLHYILLILASILVMGIAIFLLVGLLMNIIRKPLTSWKLW
jgi:hypothetical protein